MTVKAGSLIVVYIHNTPLHVTVLNHNNYCYCLCSDHMTTQNLFQPESEMIIIMMKTCYCLCSDHMTTQIFQPECMKF